MHLFHSFKLYILTILVLICQAAYSQIENDLNGLLLTRNLPLQIPYADEASALSLSPIRSIYFKDITADWTKFNTGIKVPTQNKTAENVTVFYTELALPKEWDNKQKFILITCPKRNLEVWLNGKVIAHIKKDITASIHITALLEEGTNTAEIRVKSKEILSSIEDIVAGISLFAVPAVHMNYLYNHFSWDGIHPRSGDYGAMFLQLVKNYADPSWYTHQYKNIVKVYGKQLTLQREANFLERQQKFSAKEGFISTGFHDARFQRWSAETPDLHLATIQVLNPSKQVTEVISEKVGFRTITIKNNQLQINNVPVHIKAVRFPIPATCTCLINMDSIRQVLRTVKQHNINTLIISQYPPSDEVYNLFDEFGLYVIQQIDFSENSHSIHWQKVLAAVNLLKNHPSVFAWYAEPKSADKVNYQALRDTIKLFDSQRPVFLTTDVLVENFPADINKTPSLNQLPDTEYLSELKKQYQSVNFWVKHHGENSIELTNQYDFISLQQMVLHWQIISTDGTMKEGRIAELNAAPGKTQTLKLPFQFIAHKDKVFVFTLRLNQSTSWAEAGYEVASSKFKFTSIDNAYVLIKYSE